MNYALVSALVGNIIAFVAGTALTWSSPIIPKLNDTNTDNPFDHTATDEERSWIGSLVPLGATFGPFLYGLAADKFGRKYTLTSIGIPFLAAYLLLAFAEIVPLYYVARFIIGLAIGGVFTVMPMYVGEVAEDSNRGALGSAMNCFITSGLLFSYCLGPYISIMAFNIVLAVLPAIFMPVFFFLAPESPHHHVSKGKHEHAEKSLDKLRGKNDNNAKELELIKENIEKAGEGNLLDLFRSRGLLKALIISLALVGFQQLSGINAVLFYAQDIFDASGSGLEPEISSIIVGGVQFGTSFITPLVTERLGRKMLLYISAVGMVISEIPLGLYFYMQSDGQDVSNIGFLPVLALVLYIITYNVGFGPLPWAVMGELFPANVKSAASSLTACFCWFIGFLITKFFKQMSDAMGMGQSFWLFAGFSALAFFFTLFFVVETKGKSFQEIQKLLEA